MRYWGGQTETRQVLCWRDEVEAIELWRAAATYQGGCTGEFAWMPVANTVGSVLGSKRSQTNYQDSVRPDSSEYMWLRQVVSIAALFVTSALFAEKIAP